MLILNGRAVVFGEPYELSVSGELFLQQPLGGNAAQLLLNVPVLLYLNQVSARQKIGRDR